MNALKNTRVASCLDYTGITGLHWDYRDYSEAELHFSSHQVGCSLGYWNDLTADFTEVGSLLLSENSESELCLGRLGEGQDAVSMTWRVTLTHLQWFDEDTTEIETIPCK